MVGPALRPGTLEEEATLLAFLSHDIQKIRQAQVESTSRNAHVFSVKIKFRLPDMIDVVNEVRSKENIIIIILKNIWKFSCNEKQIEVY